MNLLKEVENFALPQNITLSFDANKKIIEKFIVNSQTERAELNKVMVSINSLNSQSLKASLLDCLTRETAYRHCSITQSIDEDKGRAKIQQIHMMIDEAYWNALIGVFNVYGAIENQDLNIKYHPSPWNRKSEYFSEENIRKYFDSLGNLLDRENEIIKFVKTVQNNELFFELKPNGCVVIGIPTEGKTLGEKRMEKKIAKPGIIDAINAASYFSDSYWYLNPYGYIKKEPNHKTQVTWKDDKGTYDIATLSPRVAKEMKQFFGEHMQFISQGKKAA